MFPHLDAALESFVRSALGRPAQVLLDPPTAAWAGDRTGPALDLFLHRVEEDVAARTASWTDELDGGGRVVARRVPPRRYRFCYLLTAWADDRATEHALLADVLNAAVGYLHLPGDHLPEPLREAGVALDVAHPGLPSAPADLWAALGIAPRSSLDVVLTATLSAEPVGPLAPPPSEVDLGVARGGTARPEPVAAPRPRGRIRE